MKRLLLGFAAAMLVLPVWNAGLGGAAQAHEAAEHDEAYHEAGFMDGLPTYEPGSAAISGTLTSAGSDTMRDLMERWAAAFAQRHPEVTFNFQAEGSNTAPPALTTGETVLAPMSRDMTAGERRAFRARHGHEPTDVFVALDAVALFVRQDNPIRGLTLRQLDNIFSSTYNCGGRPVTGWDDLAVNTRGLGQIKLHGRNSASGTHDFFAERVLCGGAFAPSLTEHDTSRAVVEAIAEDRAAIGYAGLGYDNPNVRAISIADDPDIEAARFFPPYLENTPDDSDPARRFAYIIDGRYPLSRPLHIYVNKAPEEALEPVVKAFLMFILSREGQNIVLETGFVPLPSKEASRSRRRLADDYRPGRWWWFQ